MSSCPGGTRGEENVLRGLGKHYPQRGADISSERKERDVSENLKLEKILLIWGLEYQKTYENFSGVRDTWEMTQTRKQKHIWIRNHKSKCDSDLGVLDLISLAVLDRNECSVK